MKKSMVGLLVAIFLLGGSFGVAYAIPEYFTPLAAACPGTVCTACHTSTDGPPPLTDYGTAFSNIPTHSTNPSGAIATLGCPGDQLTVSKSGTGNVTVTSTPAGINCGTACSATFAVGASVSLTETPDAATTFTGWSGACKNNVSTCLITMNSDQSVTAHYLTAGTTSFSDVPSGSTFQSYIEAIYNNGITIGCGNGDYCPSADVSRDQMAAFLVRATQVSEGSQPEGFTCNGTVDCSTTTPYFSDVLSTNGFFKYIQKLKELGITVGCGSGDYCPSNNVTRDQMAAFLIRATQVVAGQGTENFTCNGNVDCSTTTPYFNDVPSINGFFKYIQKLKELGITLGCGNGNYCPSENVTRDQKAAFLSRAFLGMQ